MKICEMCGTPHNRKGKAKFCCKECATAYDKGEELKRQAKKRLKNYNSIMSARISKIEERWPFDKLPADVTMTQMCPMG